MNVNLSRYLIEPTDTIMTALRRIDANRKGFLIAVKNCSFSGTITDGDIRRAMISGANSGNTIFNVYTKNCTTLLVTKPIESAITLFGDYEFKFLPIIDESGRLVNILTKRQLEIISLRNMRVDLTYDFDSIDERLADYDICAKPWGFYKTTVLNDFYQSKVLRISPGQAISLQSHKRREEHWMVVSGCGEARIGDSIIRVGAGNTVFVPKNCKHRLTNISEGENLMVVEVQLGEGFDESDIERFEDDYMRA